MCEQEENLNVISKDGYDYFLIGSDQTKGDRRSDGRLNDDFFGAGESSMIIDNVRLSQRLHNKRSDMMKEKSVENEVDEVVESIVAVRPPNRRQQEAPGNVVPRGPAKAIKCALRQRSSRLLWLHEFFVVYGNKRKKKNPYVYQALQFLFGADVPVGSIPEMSEKNRREIWVLGVCYVPASHVRQYSKRYKGYIFHSEHNDEDAYKSLYGACPEIVRVEHFLIWHPMSNVQGSVPRVVHVDDVKQRRVHVAGRGMHYVCGVTATEDKESNGLTLTPLARGSFAMYPEDRSGMEINSSCMMWEYIEDIFLKMRQCMSAARQGTSSATFKMSCLVSTYDFWKVSIRILLDVVKHECSYIFLQKHTTIGNSWSCR